MLIKGITLDLEARGVAWQGLQEFVIWKEEKYRNLQGTYPVLSLSFANGEEVYDVVAALAIICTWILIAYSIYQKFV